jgi:S-methylmethionine-dependent homocysteine/selenocysteine methylase
MTGPVTILDGGMGRHLEAMGAPFRQPEWSALSLIEEPDFVRRAHDDFLAAGADIITVNSYAVVPFHIGEDRFEADGDRLTRLAARLAREAAAAVADRKVLVAGSLPPLFGSYRPDLFDAERAPRILSVLVEGQSSDVDLWLAESQSSIQEARAVRDALEDDARPLWLSFTLKDEDPDPDNPCLRSGEPVSDAVRAAVQLGAKSILFNCSQPEVMGDAVDTAREVISENGPDLRIGVYANAFPDIGDEVEANTGLLRIRRDLDPPSYVGFARDWVGRGATIVGGCCGIGPAHIGELRRAFG